MNTYIPATDALTWLRDAVVRVCREPLRWLGMTLMYLLFALLLNRIPFVGNFLLMLVTPVMLGGALLAARDEPSAPSGGLKGWLQALTIDAWCELLRAFGDAGQGVAIVIAAMVTLGLGMGVYIPELLITGGSLVSGLAGSELAAPMRAELAVGILVVATLYVVLAMALFFLVPLTLFGGRQAIPAVAESFRACKQHRAPLVLFVAPFLLADFAITYAFGVSHRTGYILLFTLGVFALPVFVVGLHHGYRAVFETPAAASIGEAHQQFAP